MKLLIFIFLIFVLLINTNIIKSNNDININKECSADNNDKKCKKITEEVEEEEEEIKFDPNNPIKLRLFIINKSKYDVKLNWINPANDELHYIFDVNAFEKNDLKTFHGHKLNLENSDLFKDEDSKSKTFVVNKDKQYVIINEDGKVEYLAEIVEQIQPISTAMGVKFRNLCNRVLRQYW